MLQSVQAHMGEICLVVVALFSVSESMPFFQKIQGSGILHSLYLKLKGKAIEQAKAEIAKEEQAQ